jgi:hypothetical protein
MSQSQSQFNVDERVKTKVEKSESTVFAGGATCSIFIPQNITGRVVMSDKYYCIVDFDGHTMKYYNGELKRVTW